MTAKSFKYWETQDLHEQFGLVRLKNSDKLNDWLSVQNEILSEEITQIEVLRKRLSQNANFWNEEELKIRFIGPFLEIVNLSGEDYTLFYDRPMSAYIDNIKLSGKVDMVVATGFQKPKKPFFCIHEYKQELKKDSSDPLGQLLSEMLVAQKLNDNNQIIYGSYVLGRSWYFVILEGHEYAVSDVFPATQQDDILKIFSILREVKKFIQDIIHP
jgi:hypothetical protein